MMRKTLTGLVLTALLSGTFADAVHAGRKNRARDNGTWIAMRRVGGDPQYNLRDLEKAQTTLHFIESNPGCCHRAFRGNVGRAVKTILFLSAVGIIAGGAYGLSMLKDKGTPPSDDPFRGNGTGNSTGLSVLETASPPLSTTAAAPTTTTTINPLQGQLSEALRANGQFRSELTGLRSENRRFQQSLDKLRKQLEDNSQFHGRQRAQKETRLLAKISELEAKQRVSDEKIRSTEQRLQSSEDRVRELERQRQEQDEARQRANEDARQRQEQDEARQARARQDNQPTTRRLETKKECVQRIFQESYGSRPAQEVDGWVDVRLNTQPSQYLDLCRDPIDKKVVEECLHGSCDAKAADPADACLRGLERDYRKPTNAYDDYKGVRNLSRQEQLEYCGDEKTARIMDCLGLDCPAPSNNDPIVVPLNPNSPVHVLPEQSDSVGDGTQGVVGRLDPVFRLDRSSAQHQRLFQGVDKFFEDRVLGHRDQKNVRLTVNVNTVPRLQSRANTIVTRYQNGVPSEANTNIALRTLYEPDAATVVKHEFFHNLMFGMYVNRQFVDLGSFGPQTPLFKGPKAVAAYSRMTGQQEFGIPLTHDFHLHPGFFEGEVNVICGLKRGNSFSAVAMAMLEDMGWNVRSDLADPLPRVRSFAEAVRGKIPRGFYIPVPQSCG